jgi:centromere/kinetochore protein ZW10
MWREGELSLEFGAEEVVGLVEALFAESPLRREAVREIRQGGRR